MGTETRSISSNRTVQGRIGHCLAEEESLVACLCRHFALSPGEAEWLISFGAVYLDRQRATSNRALLPGQYVRVHLQPKRFPVEGIDWPATVVHNDREFLVVNKPSGVPVHPTLDNGRENVSHQLGTALGTPVLVTQRLDTEVSGLLVLAKTREFQSEFNRLLGERKVKKQYRALVSTAPVVGRYVHYMEPSKRSPRTVSVDSRPGWMECSLRVMRVRPSGNVFEAEIDLETGRTHQIRTQLAALGNPILGDRLYGSDMRYQGDGIGLFSASTAWESRDGRKWVFTLSPPWT